MTKLKLPDPNKFTREQLAQRWKCDLSRIDAYIRHGQLKLGIDTTKVGWSWDSVWVWADPRSFDYYKSEAGNEQLLDAIRYDKPISAFVNSEPQEKQLVSCPPHLYMPATPGSLIQPNPAMIQSTLESYDAPDEAYSDPYVMVRYFYDLEGNSLIPVAKSGFIKFLVVKHRFDLLPIPLEEVERFEGLSSETSVDRVDKKTRPVAVEREGKKAEKCLEGPGIPSIAKTTDNAPADKRPPSPDSFLRLSEVRRRVGFSNTKIYQLIKDNMFPKQVKIYGGRDSRWLESEINAWIEKMKRASK